MDVLSSLTCKIPPLFLLLLPPLHDIERSLAMKRERREEAEQKGRETISTVINASYRRGETHFDCQMEEKSQNDTGRGAFSFSFYFQAGILDCLVLPSSLPLPQGRGREKGNIAVIGGRGGGGKRDFQRQFSLFSSPTHAYFHPPQSCVIP